MTAPRTFETQPLKAIAATILRGPVLPAIVAGMLGLISIGSRGQSMIGVAGQMTVWMPDHGGFRAWEAKSGGSGFR